MPELFKREKVLVQYRLLKDFDELRRRGIPGIDIRVMEDNIYEWHVTMSPISGHYSGLRIHMVLLLPEDYPRRPPKVELYNFLPHSNVFRNFLQQTAASWSHYWQGSSPSCGSYVLCTDMLEERPPPLDASDAGRHQGWSASYSVEAVLVQLQCLLFDDYVHADTGQHINTLWDHWYARPGEGRKTRGGVCSELHRAQNLADNFVCRACGFCGFDDRVAFHDKALEMPPDSDSSEGDLEDEHAGSDVEDPAAEGSTEVSSEDPPHDARCVGTADAAAEVSHVGDGDQGQAQKPSRRPQAFVSRKKQRKRELQKLKINNNINTKVDFKQQRLYMEISNSNSALVSGRALRRVPGVFKVRDVVSFRFHGVRDDAYLNGSACLNRDLSIFNYGHEVQFPWRMWDMVGQKWIYREEPEEETDSKRPNKGKESWEQFVNSQGGGGKFKAEDTPGTESYVRKREEFFASGVIEEVNAHNCTVSIVVAGDDGTLGAHSGPLTTKHGAWAYNSQQHTRGDRAVLYKNVPMEKVKLPGFESAVVPYDHPPPVNFKPMPGHYSSGDVLAYDVTKDSPVDLISILESGQGNGLTRRKLARLPGTEDLQSGCRGSRSVSQIEAAAPAVGHCSAEGNFELVDCESFEIVSVVDGGDDVSGSWDLLSSGASSSHGSFDVVSVLSEEAGSLSHSFHLVPSCLGAALSTARSEDVAETVRLVAPEAPRSDGGRAASSRVSDHSLLSLRSIAPECYPADARGSWHLLGMLCKLNVPIRGVLVSTQAFGAFISIDATPRNLAVQNRRLLCCDTARRRRGDGCGKENGKGKGKGKGEQGKILQDGLLPCLPYMRSCWPPRASDEAAHAQSAASVMVNGNIFEQLGRAPDDVMGPPEVTVYVHEVDAEQKRMRFSLQPRLAFADLRVGSKYEGIVVDTSHLGLFVALSDDLVGLLPRAQLGAGTFAERPEEDGWYRRSVYRRGDRVTVWLLRKAMAESAGPTGATGSRSKRPYKIDLTMDKYAEELRQLFFRDTLAVLDAGACGRQASVGGGDRGPASGKTAMDLRLQESYDEEDRFFLIKNNRIIQDAESQYPELVIDYQTDPPPAPPSEVKTERTDFSLIEGWSVQRITEEHKQLSDKQAAFQKASQADAAQVPSKVKPLGLQEQRLLGVLQKKVEQWGKEYYERVSKKVEQRQKFIQDIHRKIKEERDKYPYKSIIDIGKFRELTERIKDKGYDARSCFVTRLSYKEDVLGVGLQIVDEPGTGRKVFSCSFDPLSKEAFKDFGIRSGVWKEKVEFWLPLAIDAGHFRRALPFLAECFKQLGDGRVEKLTRSYGTQAGSAKYNLRAQLREVERLGRKIISLDEYRRQQSERKAKVTACCAAASDSASSAAAEEQPVPRPAASLTEADVAYGLEVLPKLMNLQTVQLMKGDLHLSTKALEGYMGFHHLLLSILRQYPSLQDRVEAKIGAFVRSEEARTKKNCPNIGEFLCLFAVSKRYTWDDVSTAIFKETLDRNASWALDRYPSLSNYGTSAEARLERTFKASVVSIRLLCFNVWFLRNIVFKRYGSTASSAEIIEAELRGGPSKNCMDARWEEYEEQKGVPKPEEIDMLQEQMRRALHGEGLNSWAEYFVSLNLKPVKPEELSQLLIMSLHDSVRKGYVPLWKLRPKAPKEKASGANDNLGADMDKYDSMHTVRGGDKW